MYFEKYFKLVMFWVIISIVSLLGTYNISVVWFITNIALVIGILIGLIATYKSSPKTLVNGKNKLLRKSKS